MQKAGTAFSMEAINLFAVNCQLYEEPVPSLGKSWKVNERIHQSTRMEFVKWDSKGENKFGSLP